jgi:hypothetical protein
MTDFSHALEMDFKFECPYCAQHIAAPVELAGVAVNCPTCTREFIVPDPPGPALPDPPPEVSGAQIDHEVKHWVVDLRVLILGAPPIYISMLIEVPIQWPLPPDRTLPPLAQDAITHAVHARFPHCPATPVKVRPACEDALKRVPPNAEYCDECCRVWLLGKTA